MLCDFHTHTFLSDGALLPMELIRRAMVKGYTAIGLTDHVSIGNLGSVIAALVAECRLAEKHWDICAIPGVELTHLPPAAIPDLAAEARRLGAELVVVHGETPVEPVAPGTNEAALRCSEVDILAHPGLIDEELAALAARSGTFLEISARKGHSLGNGAIVCAGRQAGAAFLIDSDAHGPSDLMTEEWQHRVGLYAGLSEQEVELAVSQSTRRLIEQIKVRRAGPAR